MKPLHASIKWLSRCPCCHSKHAKNISGNKAARLKAKNDIKKLLKE